MADLTVGDFLAVVLLIIAATWFMVWAVVAGARKLTALWCERSERRLANAARPTPAPRPLPLTFEALRLANLLRLPLFKNRKGETAHSKRDGSDWCLGQWSNATLGELGEAANIIKKIERGDITLDEAREDLARELADVQTYLDLLAYRAGINLGEATIRKWNEVSERIGVSVRLTDRATVFAGQADLQRSGRLSAMLRNGV